MDEIVAAGLQIEEGTAAGVRRSPASNRLQSSLAQHTANAEYFNNSGRSRSPSAERSGARGSRSLSAERGPQITVQPPRGQSVPAERPGLPRLGIRPDRSPSPERRSPPTSARSARSWLGLGRGAVYGGAAADEARAGLLSDAGDDIANDLDDDEVGIIGV